jgi:hypothetical protein
MRWKNTVVNCDSDNELEKSYILTMTMTAVNCDNDSELEEHFGKL